METTACSRRNFLKLIAVGASLPLWGRWLTAPLLAASTLLPETDATAQALSYVQDASKAPAAKRIDKMGVVGKEQFCHNCNFFKATADLNNEKVGQCTLFPSGLVKAQGWCAGWAKKI